MLDKHMKQPAARTKCPRRFAASGQWREGRGALSKKRSKITVYNLNDELNLPATTKGDK